MKRILRASKDTYITNRVIRNSFRATDANVGLAGTLDLFKLAGESTLTSEGPFISGTSEPIELSRILIKFDFGGISELTSSVIDMSHSSFKCMLRLSDVLGGQTVPSNYTLMLYPLSRSFDEGIGRDVNAFEDVDAANFITASVSSGLATWFSSGCAAPGFVGQESVDYVTGSTQLGDLFVSQTFTEGTEDLLMDVTKIVSATIAGLVPNHGFRISFSGTQETDDRTRFVKRFATRHSTEPSIRPSILVSYDDSIQDHHENFCLETTGTLFLKNAVRGAYSDILSGIQSTAITGANSILVTLRSGSNASGSYFMKTLYASQHQRGPISSVGIYSATFAVSRWESGTLNAEIQNAGSATLTEIWGSLDGTVGFYTGSFVIHDFNRSAFSNVIENLKVSITNAKQSYRLDEIARLRVFAQDSGFSFKVSKLPREAKSLSFDSMHYRLRDVNDDSLIYDFDLSGNSTRLSSDRDGMYFDLYVEDLDVGRVYGVDVLLDSNGAKQIFKNVAMFKVE